MEWSIVPFTSVGPLRFGMRRAEARQTLEKDFTPFRKTASSTRDADAYEGLGVHLYYDDRDELNFVEMMRQRGLRVLLEQTEILQAEYAPLAAQLVRTDFVVLEDGTGGYLKNAGISIYRILPADRYVSAVGAFSHSHFDEWLQLLARIADNRRERLARRGERGSAEPKPNPFTG